MTHYIPTIGKIWMRSLMHKGRHYRETMDAILDVQRASPSGNCKFDFGYIKVITILKNVMRLCMY